MAEINKKISRPPIEIKNGKKSEGGRNTRNRRNQTPAGYHFSLIYSLPFIPCLGQRFFNETAVDQENERITENITVIIQETDY